MQRHTLTPTSDKFTPPVDSYLSFNELRFVFDLDPPVARWEHAGRAFLAVGCYFSIVPRIECRAFLDGTRIKSVPGRITIKEKRPESGEYLVHLVPYPIGSVILHEVLEKPSGRTQTKFLGVEPDEVVPLTGEEYRFLVGGAP